jgi:hypothetical protein
MPIAGLAVFPILFNLSLVPLPVTYSFFGIDN